MKKRLLLLVGLVLPVVVINGALMLVLERFFEYVPYVAILSTRYYVALFLYFMRKDKFYEQFFVFCCIIANILYLLYLFLGAFGT